MQQQQNQQPLLDPGDWADIEAHLAQQDAQREVVIKRSREIQKAAKAAIYSLHRGDVKRAHELLSSADSAARDLLPIVTAAPNLRPGSYAAAVEEYAEACQFGCFLEQGRLLRLSELQTEAGLVNIEEYLGGVLDFTGELHRHVVARATQRDRAAVAHARDLVEELQGRVLALDLRNGALRRKFDTLKHTLRKLESMLYEMSLAETMGVRSFEAAQETAAAASGGGGGGAPGAAAGDGGGDSASEPGDGGGGGL